MNKTPEFIKRLEPFSELYYRMYEDIESILSKMQSGELRFLIACSKSTGETNCSWVTFHVSPIVRIEAESILRRRISLDEQGGYA